MEPAGISFAVRVRSVEAFVEPVAPDAGLALLDKPAVAPGVALLDEPAVARVSADGVELVAAVREAVVVGHWMSDTCGSQLASMSAARKGVAGSSSRRQTVPKARA
jgi:hypothetical protein